MRTTTIVLLVSAAAACSSEPVDQTGGLAAKVKHAIGDPGQLAPLSETLEYRLFQLEDTELAGDVTPESCDGVDQTLATVCGELYEEGKVGWCNYTTSFFYAHVVPRCAVRFETSPANEASMLSSVHVLDFAGTPLEGPTPGCGNGTLESNEACDDGNHEQWDGCDANCNQEEFQGCETVIEDIYQRSGIARVAADEWDGPRSHLMVNHGARALQELDVAACDQAIATATDVCNELTAQMPFVSYCQPAGMFHEEGGAPVCSIRLQVWFGQLDANFGVFTTSLPGLLAFTIR